MKVCKKCNNEFDESLFRVNSNTCFHCVKIQKAEWKKNNPEKIKLYKHREYIKNKERYLEKASKWALDRKALVVKIQDKWNKKNKDKLSLYQKRYYHNHPEIKINHLLRYKTKNIDTLSDIYVRSNLKRSGFTNEQINENPELIEIRRLIIKTKRLCETLKN